MEEESKEGFKRCSKCGRVLPISNFSKNKSRKDGLCCWCKQCKKATQAQYRQANKEKIAAYNAEYYQANKDKIAEYQAEWRAKNPTYKADYCDPQKNPIHWAMNMVRAYRQMDRERGFSDKETISAEWFLDNIAYKPCAHCGKQGIGLVGCNRLDNSKGHTQDNVESCCASCNCKENIRDQFERGTHISQICKKQSFKNFLKELKAKDKTD